MPAASQFDADRID